MAVPEHQLGVELDRSHPSRRREGVNLRPGRGAIVTEDNAIRRGEQRLIPGPIRILVQAGHNALGWQSARDLDISLALLRAAGSIDEAVPEPEGVVQRDFRLREVRGQAALSNLIEPLAHQVLVVMPGWKREYSPVFAVCRPSELARREKYRT